MLDGLVYRIRASKKKKKKRKKKEKKKEKEKKKKAKQSNSSNKKERKRERAKLQTNKKELVSWCVKPRQPQRIISVLRETFIKSYIVQRTSKAEQDQKN